MIICVNHIVNPILSYKQGSASLLPNNLQPTHIPSQHLRHNNNPRLLIPPILQNRRQYPGNRHRRPINRMRKSRLLRRPAAHARSQPSTLVVRADRRGGDFAPSEFEVRGVSQAGGEEGFDVAFSGGGGAEVCGWHFEDAAGEVEGGEDFGLDGEEVVEEGC